MSKKPASLKKMGPLRVLHCPDTVGGNPGGLARAERELGLQSWSVAFDQTYFHYPSDEVLRISDHKPILREIRRWLFFRRALFDFDIVHFNFGKTIMPQWEPLPPSARGLERLLRRAYGAYIRAFELCDLPLLKRFGKGIVMTFQGDDARQGDFCSAHFEISPAREVEPGYYSQETDAHKRYRIARLSRHADRIFALNPDLLNVLPQWAQFLPYSHIDLREWRPEGLANSASKPPVVVHAPSHRGVKGTRLILEAIAQLTSEGVRFEFVLVEGMAHLEARRIYQRADLLIDQLLCGWYGALAVELMALAKPVICYIREEDLRFIPLEMRRDLPILRATPFELCRVLREWLTLRRVELPKAGLLGRAYVEKWHDPLKIAARLKGEYETIMMSHHEGPQF